MLPKNWPRYAEKLCNFFWYALYSNQTTLIGLLHIKYFTWNTYYFSWTILHKLIILIFLTWSVSLLLHWTNWTILHYLTWTALIKLFNSIYSTWTALLGLPLFNYFPLFTSHSQSSKSTKTSLPELSTAQPKLVWNNINGQFCKRLYSNILSLSGI